MNPAPSAISAWRVESERYGPPVGRPVEVRIQSEDFAVNKKIADELKVYLSTIPGVSGVDDNLKEGPREIPLCISAVVGTVRMRPLPSAETPSIVPATSSPV